jgi:hypothetical protein
MDAAVSCCGLHSPSSSGVQPSGAAAMVAAREGCSVGGPAEICACDAQSVAKNTIAASTRRITALQYGEDR